MLARLVAITTCLFVASCASTRMTSFRDPSAANTTFKTILVIAAFGDLESRVAAEDAFVNRLENFGVRGIPSYTVISPQDEYTEDEFEQRLAESGADGLLLVSITDSYPVDIHPGEPSSTLRARERLEQLDRRESADRTEREQGNSLRDSVATDSERELTLTQPRIHTELRLFNVSTGRTAWVASSQTSGGTAARLESVMRSLADKTGKELQEHGLIAP